MHPGISVFALLLSPLVLAIASDGDCGGSTLGQLALQKIEQDGREIFGLLDESAVASASLSLFHHGAAHGRHARWMAAVPDTVPITQLNIPGTHDAATWNYSQATQDGLANATRCSDNDYGQRGRARVYRCQRRSIAESLEAGIRFFDLRFAQDPLDARLAFWHGPALLSAVADLEDVLFGFYGWLDAHPSETVLLSLQYEHGAHSDAAVQKRLYHALVTSPAARHYVHPLRGALPATLGDARGKILLFRRFDLGALPASYEETMPGIHMSPKRWLDNDPQGFELVYNDETGARAFVEDYYHPENVTLADNIEAKFAAVQAHLTKAAADDFASLFVTFTSGTHVELEDTPVYPDVMALGSAANGDDDDGGDDDLALLGVNHRLKTLLGGLRGQRLGVVIMDFFEEPGGLVDLLLGF